MSALTQKYASERIFLECFKQFYTKPNHVFTNEEAQQVKNCAYRVSKSVLVFNNYYRQNFTKFEIPEDTEAEE